MKSSVPLLLFAGLSLSSSEMAYAVQSWTDRAADYEKELADQASELVKQIDLPSPITIAIDEAYKLAKDQKTFTDKTFIDEKELEAVVASKEALANIKVKVPESLNSKSARDRLAEGINEPGTEIAAYEELAKLQEAELDRSMQISELKSARDHANELADRYQKTADTAYKLSQNWQPLIGNAWLDVFTLLTTGKTFSVSALMFEEDVQPELYKRADAARELAKRYDIAIKASESDLSAFHDTNALFSFFLGSKPPAPTLQALRDLKKIEIQRVARQLVEQQQAMEASRKELLTSAFNARARSVEADNQLLSLIGTVKAAAQDESGRAAAVNPVDVEVRSEGENEANDSDGINEGQPEQGANADADPVSPTANDATDEASDADGMEAETINKPDTEMLELSDLDRKTHDKVRPDSVLPLDKKDYSIEPENPDSKDNDDNESMTQEQWEDQLSRECERMEAAYFDRFARDNPPAVDPRNPLDETETAATINDQGKPIDPKFGSPAVDPRDPNDLSGDQEKSDPPPPGSAAIDPGRDPHQPTEFVEELNNPDPHLGPVERIDEARQADQAAENGDTLFNNHVASLSGASSRMGEAPTRARGEGSDIDPNVCHGASDLAHGRILKIGVEGPLTGPSANLGAQLIDGTRQAIDDINKCGGILGQKIELEEGDDVNDPKQGVSVANRFIGDGVTIVIGPYSSSVAKAASDVYAQNGVLMITPFVSAPALTDRGLWSVLRTCGRDDQQAKPWGAYLNSHFTGKKIAILFDGTIYGKALAEGASKGLASSMSASAIRRNLDPGATDYRNLISDLKADSTAIILWAGEIENGRRFVSEARTENLNALVMFGDVKNSEEFQPTSLQELTGTMMSSPRDPLENKRAVNIIERLKYNNIIPTAGILRAYAAVQVATQAVGDAKSGDTKKIAEAIHSGVVFDTVVGKISYDRKGDLVDPGYVIYSWAHGSNGVLRYVQQQ